MFKAKRFVIFVVAASLVTISFLWFGRPQWSSLIYLFQLQCGTHRGSDFIAPPGDYSGEWRDWWPSGKLASIEQYENGLRNGNCSYYVDMQDLVGETAHLKSAEIFWSKGDLVEVTSYLSDGKVDEHYQLLGHNVAQLQRHDDDGKIKDDLVICLDEEKVTHEFRFYTHHGQISIGAWNSPTSVDGEIKPTYRRGGSKDGKSTKEVRPGL